MITWRRFCSEALPVWFNHLDVLRLWFDIHHHCHDHCTIIKRWRDAAPSICVGREVIGILLVELERKTRKKNYVKVQMRIDKAIVQQEIANGKMRFKCDNLQHDSIFVGSKQCTVVSCMPHLSSFLSFFSFSFSFFFPFA
jgi:hypothetical protein